MRLFTYAALAALATVPFLLLVRNQEEEQTENGREVDSEDIFAFDLGEG